MKKKIALSFLLLLSALSFASSEEIVILKNGRTIVIFDDFTWKYYEESNPAIRDNSNIKDNEIPSYLRQGVKADKQTIIVAIEMYNQGWRFFMPRPKSNQAAWGNNDRRTTWYNGWWHNGKTGLYSDTTPVKKASGLYLGDNQKTINTWRNGGSPEEPDIFMWLLSTGGGPIE